jgi:putative FmdB family regulatory protein
MPTYSYQCQDCHAAFDRILRLADYDEPQTCPECGAGPAKRVITKVGFILKGDGWTGKNLRIKGQMARRRARLGAKEHEQKMDGPGVRLAPNVGGRRVDSWSEAQRLAKSEGKDTSTYEPLVRQERKEGKRA